MDMDNGLIDTFYIFMPEVMRREAKYEMWLFVFICLLVVQDQELSSEKIRIFGLE